jgi:hypothetical protein
LFSLAQVSVVLARQPSSIRAASQLSEPLLFLTMHLIGRRLYHDYLKSTGINEVVYRHACLVLMALSWRLSRRTLYSSPPVAQSKVSRLDQLSPCDWMSPFGR